MKKSFVKLILLCFCFNACRVEEVTSVIAEKSRRDVLFYQNNKTLNKVHLSKNFQIGFGEQTLVPSQPISLAGFGGIYRRMLPPNLSANAGYFTYCLPYESIDLNPRVKVQIIEGQNNLGDENFIIIVSLDVVAVTADISQKIVQFLEKKFPHKKFSQENLVLLATHSHSGPSGLTENPFWSAFACDKYSPDYFSFFQEQLASAVNQAFVSLENFSSVETVNSNLPMQNRSRIPSMPVDDRFLGILFKNKLDEVKGCVAQYSVHSTFHGQTELVLSADVAGSIELASNKQLKTESCIFFNGAVGNAEKSYGTDNLKEYGELISEEMLPVKEEKKEKIYNYSFLMDSKIISLPSPRANLSACKFPTLGGFLNTKIFDLLPERTKISYLAFDKNLLLFFPGEAVYTIQKSLEDKIFEKFPQFKNIKIVSLANDYIGYVVDEKNYTSEVLESCSTIYGSEIGRVVEDEFLGLLEKEFSVVK
jgi:Neutral/alkaline non-lysosomal ceramidase, N-terminal